MWRNIGANFSLVCNWSGGHNDSRRTQLSYQDYLTALHDVMSIQELLLCARFQPYLELGVGADVIECGDVEDELVGLGELPKAGSGGDEVARSGRLRQAEDLLRNVVHSVLLLPEAVCAVRAVY